MSSQIEQFSTYVNSFTILVIFIVGPWLPFLAGVRIIARTTRWEGSFLTRFIKNCTLFTSKYSLFVSFGNIFWALIIGASQLTYIYNKVHYENDPSYYLQVNLPAYDAVRTIDIAENKASFYSLGQLQVSNRRKLLESEALYIVYHTNHWDNILNKTELENICLSEKSILENVNCIDSTNYKSAISEIFDISTCQYWTSYTKAVSYMGQAENADYVAENMNTNFEESAILQSYFGVGSCDQDFTSEEFTQELNDYTISNIKTTFAGEKMLKLEFQEAIDDAITLCTVAAIISGVIIAISVRGLVIATTTFFCILISLINAAAVLPVMRYQSFSVFNILALFVLLVIGGNNVVLYGTAWRSCVPSGQRASVANLMDSYSIIGRSMFFTYAVTLVAVFALMVSPVIVLGQLGAFLGVSVAVFFVCFHYIIIPVWIFTNWFTLPLWVHDWWQEKLEKICCSVVLVFCGWTDVEEEEEHIYTDAAFAPSRFDDDGVTMRDASGTAIVPVDNVRFDFSNSVFVFEDNHLIAKDKAVLAQADSKKPPPKYTDVADDNKSEVGDDRSEVGSVISSLTAASKFRGGVKRLTTILRHKPKKQDNDDAASTVCGDDTETATATAKNSSPAPSVSGPSRSSTLRAAAPGNIPASTPPPPSASGGIAAGALTSTGEDDDTTVLTATKVVNEDEDEDEKTKEAKAQEPEEPVNPNEMIVDQSLLRGKRPMKLGGFFGFLFLCLMSWGCYELTLQKYSLNLNIPQLFSSHSNLGRATDITRKFKSNLLFTDEELNDVYFGILSSSSPTTGPSVVPTIAPTQTLMPSQTVIPTVAPSVIPTLVPSGIPTLVPSAVPTQFPTAPTLVPSFKPTFTSTFPPTPLPTFAPIFNPTIAPILAPTRSPTTFAPSRSPSTTPVPTKVPSATPSAFPTEGPTEGPTIVPTIVPTEVPTIVPTAVPTEVPTSARRRQRRLNEAESLEQRAGHGSIRLATVPTEAPTELPSAPTVLPFFAPSFAPTFSPTDMPLVPTVPPTRFPTNAPVFPAPTLAPSTSYPTLNVEEDHITYSVGMCWGVEGERKFKDNDVDVSYDIVAFQEYIENNGRNITGSLPSDGTGGFFDDMYALCEYVQLNRANLNIKSDWVKNRDCIYPQLVDAALSYKAFLVEQGAPLTIQIPANDIISYWARSTAISSLLAGAKVLSDDDGAPTEVLWVCANFTAESAVKDFDGHSSLAERLEKEWDDAKAAGSVYAKEFKVHSVVASSQFTFPILSYQVLQSVRFVLFVALLGFICSIGLLTFDIWVTLVGGVSMISIMAGAICCKVYFFERSIDLQDGMIIIALIGLFTVFSSQMMIHYYWAREKSKANRNPLRIDLIISPPLASMNKYFRWAHLWTCGLTGAIGIPILFSKFTMLRKLGQYLVCISVLAYIVAIGILPLLLALTRRTRIIEGIRNRIFGEPAEEPDRANMSAAEIRERNIMAGNAGGGGGGSSRRDRERSRNGGGGGGSARGRNEGRGGRNNDNSAGRSPESDSGRRSWFGSGSGSSRRSDRNRPPDVEMASISGSRDSRDEGERAFRNVGSNSDDYNLSNNSSPNIRPEDNRGSSGRHHPSSSRSPASGGGRSGGSSVGGYTSADRAYRDRDRDRDRGDSRSSTSRGDRDRDRDRDRTHHRDRDRDRHDTGSDRGGYGRSYHRDYDVPPPPPPQRESRQLSAYAQLQQQQQQDQMSAYQQRPPPAYGGSGVGGPNRPHYSGYRSVSNSPAEGGGSSPRVAGGGGGRSRYAAAAGGGVGYHAVPGGGPDRDDVSSVVSGSGGGGGGGGGGSVYSASSHPLVRRSRSRENLDRADGSQIGSN